MKLDDALCYEALASSDHQYDGLFFVGVATTGIYCRPVCSARTPRRDRCTFYRSAAEAETHGFRACFVCRPELAPGDAPVDATTQLARRAVARIQEGCLNEGSVADLASELGVTARHLRRATQAHAGATPVQLAQSARLGLAKRLLQDTNVSVTQVAMASGFGSVRRFNAVFAERFDRSPSSFRKQADAPADPVLTLRLDYRPPLDWESMVGWYLRRATCGVERVDATTRTLHRLVKIGPVRGLIQVAHHKSRPALVATIDGALMPQLMPLTARLRQTFDLDARPAVLAAHFGADDALASAWARSPGLRIPGAFSPFEAAVRAVLGQQVSVEAATTLAGRVTQRFGAPATGYEPIGLTHFFPEPAALGRAPVQDVIDLGLTTRRAATLVAVGALFAEAPPVAELLDRLRALHGVGPWTCNYVALRGLHRADIFPAGDLGIRKALGRISEREARQRAEPWAPYRSYAALALWNAPAVEATQ
jgi:AraC family transcriptional regulator, regulatory protein of adaptative response / DNA-3-methyladenine glycosylase II